MSNVTDEEPKTDDTEDEPEAAAEPEAADDAPVPRLPRGKLFGRMQMIDLFRIGMIATLLIAVIVLRKPCGDSVATFVESFDPPIDAAPAPKLEVIRLTPEEIERRFPSGNTLDAGAAHD